MRPPIQYSFQPELWDLDFRPLQCASWIILVTLTEVYSECLDTGYFDCNSHTCSTYIRFYLFLVDYLSHVFFLSVSLIIASLPVCLSGLVWISPADSLFRGSITFLDWLTENLTALWHHGRRSLPIGWRWKWGMESGVVVRGLMWREGWWETERLMLLIAYRLSLSVALILSSSPACSPTGFSSSHVETPTFNQAVLDSHWAIFLPWLFYYNFFSSSGGGRKGHGLNLSVSILGNLNFRARKKKNTLSFAQSPTFSKCSGRRAVTNQGGKKNLSM